MQCKSVAYRQIARGAIWPEARALAERLGPRFRGDDKFKNHARNLPFALLREWAPPFPKGEERDLAPRAGLFSPAQRERRGPGNAKGIAWEVRAGAAPRGARTRSHPFTKGDFDAAAVDRRRGADRARRPRRRTLSRRPLRLAEEVLRPALRQALVIRHGPRTLPP